MGYADCKSGTLAHGDATKEFKAVPPWKIVKLRKQEGCMHIWHYGGENPLDIREEEYFCTKCGATEYIRN